MQSHPPPENPNRPASVSVPEHAGPPKSASICVATASCGRRFAAFPVAVVALAMDAHGRFLLLRRPGKSSWEPPSGALEAGESPLSGLRRELREELGPDFAFQVLGPVHATSFRFDSILDNVVGIAFAVRHLRGPVVPSDDMAGADVDWVSLDDLRLRPAIPIPGEIEPYALSLDLFRRHPAP